MNFKVGDRVKYKDLAGCIFDIKAGSLATVKEIISGFLVVEWDDAINTTKDSVSSWNPAYFCLFNSRKESGKITAKVSHKFKIGDYVKIINKYADCYNKIGIVKRIDNDSIPYKVVYDDLHYNYYNVKELQLVNGDVESQVGDALYTAHVGDYGSPSWTTGMESFELKKNMEVKSMSDIQYVLNKKLSLMDDLKSLELMTSEHDRLISDKESMIESLGKEIEELKTIKFADVKFIKEQISELDKILAKLTK